MTITLQDILSLTSLSSFIYALWIWAPVIAGWLG